MSFACPPFEPSQHDLLALTANGMLDPVLFGVLTTAVEEEAAEAYRVGFDDGIRTAMLRADPHTATEFMDEFGLPLNSSALEADGSVRP
jgi:hypothetical protein